MLINLAHSFGLIKFLYYFFLIISSLITYLLRKKQKINNRYLLGITYLLLLPIVLLQIISLQVFSYLYLFTLVIPSLVLLKKDFRFINNFIITSLFILTIFNALLTTSKLELKTVDIVSLFLLILITNLSIIMITNISQITKLDIIRSILVNLFIVSCALLLNIFFNKSNATFLYLNKNIVNISTTLLFYFYILTLVLFNILYFKYKPNNILNILIKKYPYLIYSILFIISNLITNTLISNTGFAALFELLDLNIFIKFNAILADLFFLLTILVLVNNITSSKKTRAIILLVIAFIFNFFNILHITSMGSFQVPLNKTIIDLGKGPATEYNNTVPFMALRDIFYYKLYVLLTPFTILLGALLIYKDLAGSKNKLLKNKKLTTLTINLRVIATALFFILFAITQFIGLDYIKQAITTDSIKHKMSWQVNGVFGFYLNFPFIEQSFNHSLSESEQRIIKNFTFSNDGLKELNNIEGIRNLSELKDIFKERNIVMFTLESTSNFMIFNDPDNILYPYRRMLLPDLYDLIDEGYLFNHFHANEGVGHSTDGMFSSLTGLPNHGLLSMAYQYDYIQRENLLQNSLPKLLRDNNYFTSTVELVTPLFYNLNKTLPSVYQFNEAIFYDENNYLDEENKLSFKNSLSTTFKNLALENDYTKGLAKYASSSDEISLFYNKYIEGLSDKFMVDFLAKYFKNKVYTRSNPDNKKHFINAYTMLPHIPNTGLKDYDVNFGYNSKGAIINKEIHNLVKHLKFEDYKYLQFTGYLNSFFKEVKKLIKILPNTIFLFQGDHIMTNFDPNSLQSLYKTKLNKFQLREKYREVFAMAYIPDDFFFNKKGLKKGLVKGSQNLIRSQNDFYATIVELLNLEPKRKHYGINLFTQEKQLVLDSRHGFLFGDDFITSPEFSSSFKQGQYFLKTNDYSLDKILRLKNRYFEFKIAYDKMIFSNNYRYLNY